MAERKVLVGGVYRHFKGTNYVVLSLAVDANTKKPLVLYHNPNDPEHTLWVRAYDEFLSEVDKEKYRYVTQKWRFELVGELF